MDYVWSCWIADCHELYRFLQKFFFVSAEHSSERLQRRMNASILSLSEVRVKPIQASVLPKLQRWIRCVDTRGLDRVLTMSLTQITDLAQLLSTLSTCSFTVRVLVTVTPRIFMLSTRLISVSSAGNWVECFRERQVTYHQHTWWEYYCYTLVQCQLRLRHMRLVRVQNLV